MRPGRTLFLTLPATGAVTVAAALTVPAVPAAADGLGGLSAMPALGVLFLIGAIVVAAGVALVLAQLIGLTKQGSADKPKTRLTVVSVAYLVLFVPVFAWILLSPQLTSLHYGLAALYLSLLGLTVLRIGGNVAWAAAVVGALFLAIVLRTPQIVSYTAYDYIDNVPLDRVDPLAAQRDDEIVRFADGRTFRIGRRSSGPGKPMTADKRIMIEETTLEDGRVAYGLITLTDSPRYASHKLFDPKPLITIPLRREQMEVNAPARASAELLPADWAATQWDLKRALYNHCCDAGWIQELIDRGADPTDAMIGSRNPLHYFSASDLEKQDYTSAARVLIAAGVELNVFDQWGNTPLEIAVSDFWGRTMLDPVSSKAYFEYIRLLLESGADPNLLSKPKRSPLFWALWFKNYGLADLLLDYGADPDIEDHDGDTPRKYLARRHASAVRYGPDHADTDPAILKKLLDRMESGIAE